MWSLANICNRSFNAATSHMTNCFVSYWSANSVVHPFGDSGTPELRCCSSWTMIRPKWGWDSPRRRWSTQGTFCVRLPSLSRAHLWNWRKGYDYDNFIKRETNLSVLPECPPEIEAHHIQPEEADHEGEVDNEAKGRAHTLRNLITLAGQLDEGQGGVANGQAQHVTHQGLAMKIAQFGDECIHEECDEQEWYRHQHS